MGTLHDPTTQEELDQVVVTVFFAPRSYTGEDLAEIGTHGNPVVVGRVLAALLAAGARSAEAGEFTRRAFLNGNMDLLTVEATGRILAATSFTQVRLALAQMDGVIAGRIRQYREEMLASLAHLEASLSFPEDAVEAIDIHLLQQNLHRWLTAVDELRRLARDGQLLSVGLPVVLYGRPNTGKSSLLNAILGKDRAIVTDIPGTTRDTLEETLDIEGFPLRLIDSAGFRTPQDRIEELGIHRTEQALAEAFVIIGVFDRSAPLTTEDHNVLARLAAGPGKPLLVLNKTDLPRCQVNHQWPDTWPMVEVSALTGNGLDSLRRCLAQLLRETGLDTLEETVLLGAGQLHALEKCHAALHRAVTGIGVIYEDMLAIDLEEAVRELGRVTGETMDLNTLDRIFATFCIGK